MGIAEIRTVLDAALRDLGSVQDVRMDLRRQSSREEADPVKRELQVISFVLHGAQGASRQEITLPGDAPLIPTLRTHAELLAANLSLESP